LDRKSRSYLIYRYGFAKRWVILRKFSVNNMKSYTSFLRNYFLHSSLYDFIFAYAIYTVFFSLQGLSDLQISLLLTWWALTSVLLEIPSGALADFWSRRKMLIIAPWIKALCFVCFFFAAGDFYMFALGLLLWSISGTMLSGTTEAYLYDLPGKNPTKKIAILASNGNK